MSSIFDIYAANELDALLHQVVDYLCEFLLSTRLGKAVPVINRVSSSYLAMTINSLSQGILFLCSDSTIGEYTYGLRHDFGSFHRLSKLIYFLYKIALPKVKQFLENIYEELSYLDRADLKTNWSSRERIFLSLYPPIRCLISTMNLGFFLLYVAGRTKFNDLAVFVLKCSFTSDPRTDSNVWPQALQRRSYLWIFLRRAFFAFMFCVQFAQWWRNNSSTAASLGPGSELGGTGATNTIPPPATHPIVGEAWRHWRRNVCPLCSASIANPVFLPSSGFVFCYKCLSKHLREHAICPVTRLPCTQADMRRLFVDAT